MQNNFAALIGEADALAVYNTQPVGVLGMDKYAWAAFALARLLGSLLYGVPAGDPVLFVAVPVLMAAVAFLAAWIPARRASFVNPVRALKAD